MTQQIYVNLPVKDLSLAMHFFLQLGFNFNRQLSNETGACMIIGENIYVMLLDQKFFATFTTKTICNAKESTQVLIYIDPGARI